MKYYRLFWGLLLVCSSSSIWAQDFNSYQRLESSGEIPAAFLANPLAPFEKDKTKSSTDYSTDMQASIRADFLLDDLLKSGDVLFNDPLSQYLGKVADELLKNQPNVRAGLSFHVVRSTAMHAFASPKGMIFVNLGLLARLETEAQLAYLLARQIAHVQQKHPLELSLSFARINRYTKYDEILQFQNYTDDLAATNFYPTTTEIQTDKAGLELFLKSSYHSAGITGFFDLCAYGELPFELEDFDPSFLENDVLEIPSSYFLLEEQLKSVQPLSNTSENLYPDIRNRKTSCINDLVTVDNTNKSTYLVKQEAEFKQLRDIARFEIAYAYLDQFRYQDALYATYLLSKKYPNNPFLEKTTTKALYGYTKFKNDIKGVKPYVITYNEAGVSNSYMRDGAYKKVQGPQQQVYYMLSSMQPKEVTVLSLRYAWDTWAKYPNDAELTHICKDLFTELAFFFQRRDNFSKISKKELDKTNRQNSGSDSLSKYATIKQPIIGALGESMGTTQKSFSYYAFADILDDSKFINLFEKGQAAAKRLKNRAEYYRTSQGRSELRSKRRRRAIAMGIDSILIVQPFYLRILDYGKPRIDFISSAKRINTFEEVLEKNAALAKLQYKMLHTSAMNSGAVADLNALNRLKEWVSQQNRFGQNLLLEGFDQNSIDALRKQYNSRYILMPSIISLQRSQIHWILCTVVFDLKTGRYQVVKDTYYRKKDGRVLMNAHVFDALFQIKSKP